MALYLEFATKEFVDPNNASSVRNVKEIILKIQVSSYPQEF